MQLHANTDYQQKPCLRLSFAHRRYQNTSGSPQVHERDTALFNAPADFLVQRVTSEYIKATAYEVNLPTLHCITTTTCLLPHAKSSTLLSRSCTIRYTRLRPIECRKATDHTALRKLASLTQQIPADAAEPGVESAHSEDCGRHYQGRPPP